MDGITSTVILRRAIELLGANVAHFVPDRLRDGYGLQPATVERLHEAGARLIVSVDCGIRASEAAVRARELGVDLIITDHHEPEATLPPALAVINPKRTDCAYPDKYLAGVGVALKLVQALLAGSERGAELLPHFIKIAAIGTLADVVPLVGENRVIARYGLAGLSRGPHGAGVEALLEESGLLGRTLDSFHVSFVLAPRLNAAGRMSSPDLAVDLLLLRGREDAIRQRARMLARQLTEENTRRQAQEAEILADARRTIDHDPEIGAQNILVVVRPRLAPRRHRHRRLEADGAVSQARHRAGRGGRTRPWIGAQHRGVRPAGRARVLRGRVPAIRRASPGGGRHDRGRADWGDAAPPGDHRQRSAGAVRSGAAAAESTRRSGSARSRARSSKAWRGSARLAPRIRSRCFARRPWT